MTFIEKHIHGDRKIWIAVLILVLFSFLAVYSSTGSLAYAKANGNVGKLLLRHAQFLFLGLCMMVVASKIKPHVYLHYATLLLVLSIGALGLAFVMGHNVNGAARWVNLGLFSFQPSEIAKFALIIFIAKHLARHQHPDRDARKAFWPIVLAMILVIGPIFKENLSTAVLIFLTCIGLMVLGRIPILWITGLGTFLVGVFVVLILMSPYIPALKRVSTWKARIERFVNPSENESDSGNFQSEKAKMAVGSGGILGKGPGNSYYRNVLPMAFSDFIFAIILEEYGMLGGILLVVCYVVFMTRALSIVKKCDRAFPIFLVLGITMLLLMQAAINMGVSVGLLPVTGQTLPMVSMGGTSNVITGAVIGIILSVSRYVESFDSPASSAVAEPEKPAVAAEV